MKDWLIPLLAGLGTGILSAWGVGGGTLLLLVMTLFLGVAPEEARIINLLYFLPTAAVGLYYHRKNGILDTQVIKTAVPWGLAAAPAAALLTAVVDTSLLRRPFGIYLLVMGAVSLCKKKEEE